MLGKTQLNNMNTTTTLVEPIGCDYPNLHVDRKSLIIIIIMFSELHSWYLEL